MGIEFRFIRSLSVALTIRHCYCLVHIEEKLRHISSELKVQFLRGREEQGLGDLTMHEIENGNSYTTATHSFYVHKGMF